MKNKKRYSKTRLTFHYITVLCMSRDIHSGKRVRHVFDIFLHLMQLTLILSKSHVYVSWLPSFFFLLYLGDLWDIRWLWHLISKQVMHIEYCTKARSFYIFFYSLKKIGLQTRNIFGFERSNIWKLPLCCNRQAKNNLFRLCLLKTVKK